MKGYRPEFYNPDAKLHSIEILDWAAKRDVFTINEARDKFRSSLKDYEDPEHEISERLRKLLKSGNIIIVTPGDLKTLLAAGTMSVDLATALAKRLDEIQKSKTPGRKPRLYRISQTGAKYVETRREDLERISKEKKKPK